MGTKWWTDREEIDFWKAHYLEGKTREQTEHAWHLHPVFGERHMPSRVQVQRKIDNEGWVLLRSLYIPVGPALPSTPPQPGPLHAQDSMYSASRMQPLQYSTLPRPGIDATAGTSAQGHMDSHPSYGWYTSTDHDIPFGFPVGEFSDNANNVTPNPRIDAGIASQDESISAQSSVPSSAHRTFSPPSTQPAASSSTRDTSESTAASSEEPQAFLRDESPTPRALLAPWSQDPTSPSEQDALSVAIEADIDEFLRAMAEGHGWDAFL